ncbi:hypothetical protein [Myroides odoratimimus]|uniref:hypothetical protein n=1 Tax=Myroides odoratimimus TaxID=76832 RepID=UPI002DB98C09|nr:hypothetical protein [Myroides odoratimimus]MEC4028769.1 hypothetical protein [Myroides odoratimimus]
MNNLQNFFDKEYSRFITKGSFQSIYRFSIRFLSNLILPIYFLIIRAKKNKEDNTVIVSLTTFPDRISRFWLVIECILRQDVRPYKIYVWLAKEQFPEEMENLPKKLVNYHNKGLVNFVFVEEDFRSHKKYYYAFKEFDKYKIITLDDDIIYPSFLLRKLLETSEKHPKSICCLRGYEVLHNEFGVLLPYKKWNIIRGSYGPALDFFHTSGGGTLYKVNFFDEEVFNEKVFSKHCLYADDVWLNVMAQFKRTSTVKVDYYSNLLPVMWNGKFRLSSNNVNSGGNDEQLANLIRYYNVSEESMFK